MFGKDAVSPGIQRRAAAGPWAGNGEGQQFLVSTIVTSSVTAAAAFAAPASA